MVKFTKSKITLAACVALLILIISCQKKNEAVVNGTIWNGEGKYLYYSDFTNNPNTPDSSILGTDGKFKIRIQATNPRDFAFFVKKGDYIRLIVSPGEKIELSAHADSMQLSYKVTGSLYSEQVFELYKHLNYNIDRVDSLSIIFRQYQNSNKLDSILPILRKKSDAIFRNERDFLLSFIENNPGSPASYVALSMQFNARAPIFKAYEDYEWFKKVDSALNISYPASDISSFIHSFVMKVEDKIKVEKEKEKRVGIGAFAPEIALPSPKGDTLRLSSLRGKYVLLDFWAAWCKPCRVENPNLVKAFLKYRWKGKGFDIFQVSLDKSKEDWLKAIRADNLRWKHVSDLKFWGSAPVPIYGVQGIPANFLLDPDGKIIAKNLRGEELEKKLAEIFK